MLSYISGKQNTSVLLTYFCVLLFCLHSKCLLACGKVNRDTLENGTILADAKFSHFSRPINCIWKIEVPTDYRIELTVHVFEIKTSCCKCIDDYVEFRDGLSSTSPLIGRYCANSRPKKVYSSQNVLRVKYFSSSKNRPVNLTTVNKFKASYRKICGKFIRKISAVIRSPPLYQNFASVNRCLFTIVVPYGWIKVTFTNFTVGKSVACHTDFVMIKETAFVEVEGTALKHEHLCGKLKSFYIFSKGHELSFLYQSSKVVESRFAATFKGTNTSMAPCGGLLTNNAGYIYSYGYPKPYPRAAECVWKIEVQHGYYIELKFLEFSFANMTTGCANGQVEVYDGWSSNSVKIETACYQPREKTWTSKSNRLLIKATSKNNEAGVFVLSYKLVKQSFCSASKFLCTSRQCLRKSTVCDGIDDCSDGSDELNCPKKKHGKSLYVIWILIVFFASILMVIWLWRTWRKAVHRTVQIQRNQCPEADDYACEVPSQSGAPPTYSEALNHTPTSLPTYEEALLNENGEVIVEQGNTVRYHARSDSCSRHLLPLRYDSQRRHGNNTRRSPLGIV